MKKKELKKRIQALERSNDILKNHVEQTRLIHYSQLINNFVDSVQEYGVVEVDENLEMGLNGKSFKTTITINRN